MKAALGAALLAAHLAALPVALARCHRDELAVTLRGDAVAPRFELRGDATGGAHEQRDGDGPGLHRVRWRVDYRGGFTREVGAAQLVGPFQDPARPGCGARVVVGARFLAEQVAPLVSSGLEAALRGFEQWPAGAFRRVAAVDVTWARFDDGLDPDVFASIGAAGAAALAIRDSDGYARVHAIVELERVTIAVVVALVPRVDPAGDRLRFQLFAHAALRAGNPALDWALERVHADDYATGVIRDQLDAAILSVLEPPPPLELPGGRALRIAYCPGARVEIARGSHAALPLALAFGGPAGPGALPPRLGPATPPPVAPGTSLAFDLDLDTVNALLHELWRTGFLDEQLDAAGLDARFNGDPTVTALLSLRISPLRLALAPVVTPGPRGLRMAADLRADLADRARITPARLWTALDVALDPRAQRDPRVDLAELELACEPTPRTLRPCYADLVEAARGRAADARTELSALLVRILDDLVTGRRVTTPDAPAELVLGAPRTTSHPSGASAVVRIAVEAHLASIR